MAWWYRTVRDTTAYGRKKLGLRTRCNSTFWQNMSLEP